MRSGQLTIIVHPLDLNYNDNLWADDDDKFLFKTPFNPYYRRQCFGTPLAANRGSNHDVINNIKDMCTCGDEFYKSLCDWDLEINKGRGKDNINVLERAIAKSSLPLRLTNGLSKWYRNRANYSTVYT